MLNSNLALVASFVPPCATLCPATDFNPACHLAPTRDPALPVIWQLLIAQPLALALPTAWQPTNAQPLALAPLKEAQWQL